MTRSSAMSATSASAIGTCEGFSRYRGSAPGSGSVTMMGRGEPGPARAIRLDVGRQLSAVGQQEAGSDQEFIGPPVEGLHGLARRQAEAVAHLVGLLHPVDGDRGFALEHRDYAGTAVAVLQRLRRRCGVEKLLDHAVAAADAWRVEREAVDRLVQRRPSP